MIKNIAIYFLQAVTIFIGILVLMFLLVEPHFEERNIDASWSQIYFNDSFLLYVYTGSITFFIALYQTLKLLTYIKNNKFFSAAAKKSFNIIKKCSYLALIFILGAEAYLMLIIRPIEEDIAGGVMLGFLLTFILTIVIATITILEKIQNK